MFLFTKAGSLPQQQSTVHLISYWDCQLINLHETPITDIVETLDVSVRLKNCLTNASHDGLLPITTIGGYLEASNSERAKFLYIQNFGRKCQKELNEIVNAYAKRFNDDDVAPSEEKFSLNRNVASEIFSTIPFPDCILDFPLSVRLQHALQDNRARIISSCPDLASVVRHCSEWIQGFRSFPNVGRKSVSELETVLQKLIVVLLQHLRENNLIVIDDIDIENIAFQLVRTDKSQLSFPEQDFDLESIEKLELDWPSILLNGVADPFISQALNSLPANPEHALNNFLRGTLDAREFDVVSRRYGFFSEHIQTLQEIADAYEITRERVRQLQVKAIKRCSPHSFRPIFVKYIDIEFETALLQLIGDKPVVTSLSAMTLHKELPGYLVFAAKIAFENIENFLSNYLVPVEVDGQLLGWCRHSANDEERDRCREILLTDIQEPQRLSSRLKKTFETGTWPFTLSDLASTHRSFSYDEIRNAVISEFGAELDGDNILKLGHLPAKARLILTLRDLKRSAHASDIRAHHNKLFHKDISENAARNTLSRLEEALIVDRGTYCLYEHLSLSANEVTHVSDYCYTLLLDRQCYVSAKLLAKQFSSDFSAISSRITPYIVLGICQDDPRFSFQRGLMVGLAQEGFDETFSSLTDTIHSVVKKYGPISIAGIKAHVADTRELFDANVSTVIGCSTEIVRVSWSEYDVVDRVFGLHADRIKLDNAVQLTLVNGPCSAPLLNSRISALGYHLNKIALLSYVKTLDFVDVSKSLISLNKIDTQLALYSQIFDEKFEPTLPLENVKTTIASAATEAGVGWYPKVDFRLVMPPREWATSQESDDETNSIINEMMEEFDF